MLTLGIDVLILIIFGCLLVLMSYLTACVVPLTIEEGTASIVSTAITAGLMVLAYVLMARVLDMTFGPLGW